MAAFIEEDLDEQRARDAILAIDRDLPLPVRLVSAVAILQDRTRRVFSLTHPLLGDETLARPDRIVDLVLHGIARTPAHPGPTQENPC